MADTGVISICRIKKAALCGGILNISAAISGIFIIYLCRMYVIAVVVFAFGVVLRCVVTFKCSLVKGLV